MMGSGESGQNTSVRAAPRHRSTAADIRRARSTPHRDAKRKRHIALASYLRTNLCDAVIGPSHGATITLRYSFQPFSFVIVSSSAWRSSGRLASAHRLS